MVKNQRSYKIIVILIKKLYFNGDYIKNNKFSQRIRKFFNLTD